MFVLLIATLLCVFVDFCLSLICFARVFVFNCFFFSQQIPAAQEQASVPLKLHFCIEYNHHLKIGDGSPDVLQIMLERRSSGVRKYKPLGTFFRMFHAS